MLTWEHQQEQSMDIDTIFTNIHK